MESKPYNHAFKYKDVPSVAETFVDGVELVTVDGQTTRILLTVSRSDEPKPGAKGPPTGQKVTAARLVMPLSGMAELFTQLERMVIALEQRGLLHRDNAGVKPSVQ